MSTASKSDTCLALLRSKLGPELIEASVSLGDVVVRINRSKIIDIFKLLKLDTELAFNFLVDITAIDWMDSRTERFDVVYHLLSLKTGNRVRIKAAVPETAPEIASVTPLWGGANFMEREVWDMYGIKFSGHPDLRRILMYDEFEGHPLRKDFPVQGKQPRMPLRNPEVRNTAVDMQRAPLVQISPKRKGADSSNSRANA